MLAVKFTVVKFMDGAYVQIGLLGTKTNLSLNCGTFNIRKLLLVICAGFLMITLPQRFLKCIYFSFVVRSKNIISSNQTWEIMRNLICYYDIRKFRTKISTNWCIWAYFKNELFHAYAISKLFEVWNISIIHCRPPTHKCCYI